MRQEDKAEAERIRQEDKAEIRAEIAKMRQKDKDDIINILMSYEETISRALGDPNAKKDKKLIKIR